MFKLYEKVKIKSNGIIGTIVDISIIDKNANYVVESDEKDVSDGYGGKWKLFDCSEEEIESIA